VANEQRTDVDRIRPQKKRSGWRGKGKNPSEVRLRRARERQRKKRIYLS